MKKKRVHIFCMGRARRDLDAQRLSNYFVANGCDIVWNPRTSDINILVTCAFCKTRENEAFAHINRFKKYRGELIVLGCLPGIAPERLKQEFGGRSLAAKDLVLIDTLFSNFKIKFQDIPDSNDLFIDNSCLKRYLILMKGAWTSHFKPFIREFELSREFLSKFIKRQLDRTQQTLRGAQKVSKYIRISNGCLGKCTYCAIRFATGELRSKPLDECVREFTGNLRRGYRRFRLIGEDVGAYGFDIGSSFSELLSKYEDASNGVPYKLNIETLNPRWVVKYKEKIMEMVKAGSIEEFECDIQSGNERILKLMNRYSDIGVISETLSEIMAANKNTVLYSQFIVGFPSETEEDFQDTLSLISKLKIHTFNLFPYSEMEVTDASKMPDKIPTDIINRRIGLMKKALEKDYTITYEDRINAYLFIRLKGNRASLSQ